MTEYFAKSHKINKPGSLNREQYRQSSDFTSVSQPKWRNLEKNSPQSQKMEAIQMMAKEYGKNISQKKSKWKGVL